MWGPLCAAARPVSGLAPPTLACQEQGGLFNTRSHCNGGPVPTSIRPLSVPLPGLAPLHEPGHPPARPSLPLLLPRPGPADYATLNVLGSKYFLYHSESARTNWDSARAICQARGLDLATTPTQQVADALYTAVAAEMSDFHW